MKKRLMALILIVCVCFGSIPVFLQAALLDNNTVNYEKRIFAGNQCSFVIKDDGSLWGWGRNKYGRLGDGTELNRVNPVKIMDDVDTFIPSYTNGYALKSDGSLWGWGTGAHGLFDGSQLTPVKIMDGVAQISGDGSAHVILKNDGSLWLSGWLMGSEHAARHSPEKIMDGIRFASLENDVFHIIKNDGSLWVSGISGYERLGIDGDISIPVKVADGVTYVTSDLYITYIIKEDGSLLGFGDNKDGILEETVETYTAQMVTSPIKIDDGVLPKIALYTVESPLYYIKNDNTLWKLNSYSISGQRTQTIVGVRPVKVMDDVRYIDSSGEHIFIVQNNGNMWAAGKNEYGQLGDGTTDSKFNPASVAMVTTVSEASETLRTAINMMTSDEKQLPLNINNVLRYAEEAITNVANKNVSEDVINIDKDFVTELLGISHETRSVLNETLISNGIELDRPLSRNICVTTSSERGFTVNVERSVLDTEIDNIYVKNRDIGIEINRENLEGAEHGEIYTVSIESSVNISYKSGTLVAAADSEKYTLNLKNNKTPLKVQVPVKAGTVPAQLAAKSENNEAVLSQYNSANSKMEFKTYESGDYALKENVIDFSDIQELSFEMKEAINFLANKNVIFGNEDKYFPNDIVNRAEIATLMVRATGKFDAKANAGFKDVPTSKWYCAGVGSAYKMGIVSGMSATHFEPESFMLKDQILVVASRVLQIEKKFGVPDNADEYFVKFSDKDSIKDWSKSDLALAVKHGLVEYRADGKLQPNSNITRSDATIILYRLNKIAW